MALTWHKDNQTLSDLRGDGDVRWSRENFSLSLKNSRENTSSLLF